jgi:hypothetical protein
VWGGGGGERVVQPPKQQTARIGKINILSENDWFYALSIFSVIETSKRKFNT